MGPGANPGYPDNYHPSTFLRYLCWPLGPEQPFRNLCDAIFVTHCLKLTILMLGKDRHYMHSSILIIKIKEKERERERICEIIEWIVYSMYENELIFS